MRFPSAFVLGARRFPFDHSCGPRAWPHEDFRASKYLRHRRYGCPDLRQARAGVNPRQGPSGQAWRLCARQSVPFGTTRSQVEAPCQAPCIRTNVDLSDTRRVYNESLGASAEARLYGSSTVNFALVRIENADGAQLTRCTGKAASSRRRHSCTEGRPWARKPHSPILWTRPHRAGGGTRSGFFLRTSPSVALERDPS
jgi:hypothetical protein